MPRFQALCRQWDMVPPACISLAVIARIKPKRKAPKLKLVEGKIDPAVFAKGKPPPWEREGEQGMTLKDNNHVIRIVGGIDWKGNPRG